MSRNRTLYRRVDIGRYAARLARMLPFGLLALGGCAIATPYRTVATPADGTASVVVAVTWATLDPERRATFDRYTGRLVNILQQQPGLLGYSLRRELLGNDVWTVTVWSSDEARRAFVYSALHQEAITETYAAVVKARFARYTAMPSELPPAWSIGLRRLQQAEAGS